MSGCKSVIEITQQKYADYNFKKMYSGCFILSQNKKILLQQRALNWSHYPGYFSEFGGGIDANETHLQAILRELYEELGAIINEKDIIYLGAISEAETNYQEIIYEYFWHDRSGSITGCYEGEARYFDDAPAILREPKVTASVHWLLARCQQMV